MTTALQLIEELERLRSKATAGDWAIEIDPTREGDPLTLILPKGAAISDKWIATCNFNDDDTGPNCTPQEAERNCAVIAAAVNSIPTLATTIRELAKERDRLRNVVLCARDVKCPRDTNGDNDCGQPGCPVCGPGGIKPYAKSALLAGKEQQ